jgi:predicted  nucleic acid-binding Zn-ribbon protein
MPHECTNCGRTFPDGSKEMLSGCPDCGGNKFKFEPAGRAAGGESASEPEGESPSKAGGGPAPGSERDTGHDADRSPPAESVTDRSSPAADADQRDDEPFADHEWPDTASTEPPDAHDKTGRAGQPTISPDEEPTPTDTTGAPDGVDSTADTVEPTTDTTEEAVPATDTTESTTRGESEFEYSSAAERSAAEQSPNTATDRPGAQSGDRPHADIETTGDRGSDAENSAQASARSEVVSGEELPDYADSDDTTATHDSTGTESPASDESSLSEPSAPDESSLPEADDTEFERIREELNQQFESIRIVRPGEYELNLVELYDREEFIISLREDGRYVIEMPDAWDTDTE